MDGPRMNSKRTKRDIAFDIDKNDSDDSEVNDQNRSPTAASMHEISQELINMSIDDMDDNDMPDSDCEEDDNSEYHEEWIHHFLAHRPPVPPPGALRQPDRRSKVLYRSAFINHFGMSDVLAEGLDFAEQVNTGLPPDVNVKNVKDFCKDLLAPYDLTHRYFCNSCSNALVSYKDLCATPGCRLQGKACKRSKNTARCEIISIDIRPQLAEVVQDQITEIVEHHGMVHNGLINPNNLGDSRNFAWYRDNIESPALFAQHQLRLVLTIGSDGFVPKRLSKSEYWPIYIRIESICSKYKSHPHNIILVSCVKTRHSPTEGQIREATSRLRIEVNSLLRGHATFQPMIVTDDNNIAWEVDFVIAAGIADFQALHTFYRTPRWNSVMGCHKCIEPGTAMGRTRHWLVPFPQLANNRTTASVRRDSRNARNGLARYTTMMDIITVNCYPGDALHILSEGVSKDRLRDLFQTDSKCPPMKMTQANIDNVKKSIEGVINYTYNNRYITSFEELSKSTGAEVDELCTVVFPLIGSCELTPLPCAGASIVGYWFIIRKLQETTKLNHNVIQQVQNVGENVKTIWGLLNPAMFTLKTHHLFDHILATELPYMGSPYDFSASPFENMHRKLQIAMNQYSTNGFQQSMEIFLLNKSLSRLMAEEAAATGNILYRNLAQKMDNMHVIRHPLELRLGPNHYIPKHSNMVIGDVTSPLHHNIVQANMPFARLWKRVVINDKCLSSRYYWNRTNNSRQDLFYGIRIIANRPTPIFGSLIIIGTQNGHARALVEEYILQDPFIDLYNSNHNQPHPCRRAAGRILDVVRNNNDFFYSVTNMALRIIRLDEIHGPAHEIKHDGYTFISRI